MDRDCLEQPRRLQQLEVRVAQLKAEINYEFLSSLNESKMAYLQAKKCKVKNYYKTIEA